MLGGVVSLFASAPMSSARVTNQPAPNGVFYYALELLDGIDLEQPVKREGRVAPARAIHIVRHVADALSEAHGIELIHRDIKPANIIPCERWGRPDVAKVVDFGLVKNIENDGARCR